MSCPDTRSVLKEAAVQKEPCEPLAPHRIGFQPVLCRCALNRVKNSCVEDVKKFIGQTTNMGFSGQKIQENNG